jgi:hypothetical protein
MGAQSFRVESPPLSRNPLHRIAFVALIEGFYLWMDEHSDRANQPMLLRGDDCNSFYLPMHCSQRGSRWSLALVVSIRSLYWRFANSLHPAWGIFSNPSAHYDRMSAGRWRQTCEIESAIGYELPK